MIGRNVTVAAALTLLSLLPASAKTYHAERYLVDLSLDRQGDLHVTETAVFHFADGPFRFVYRDLSAKHTDGISDITATMDGRACEPGGSPGQVEIRGHNVRWHFAPLDNQSHTFGVSYIAHGVIRPGGNAESLLWRALPEERSYQTDEAIVDLTYPAGLLSSSLQSEASGNRATATYHQVPAHREIVVSAQFAPGTFHPEESSWLVARSAERRQLREGMAWGAVPGLLLLLGVLLWISRSRIGIASPPPAAPVEPQRLPPDDLSPALAGRLLGRPVAANAVLLDLARRGVVSVEETKPGTWRHDYQLYRQAHRDEQLAPHETVWLEISFRGAQQTTLHQSQQRVAVAARKLQAAIKQELLDARLLDPDRLHLKARFFLVGTLFVFGATAAAVIAALFVPTLYSGGVTAVAFALALSWIASWASAGAVQTWTATGALEASRWKLFQKHLRDTAHGLFPLPTPDEWDSLLPYAVALGVGTQLARRAKKEGSLLLPSWFTGWQNNPDSDAFASFLIVSSTSSGGADGGAAAAAASGGGSSGAG